MLGEADLEFATLDQSQIQVLSGFQCSEEDRPKLRDEVHEKMTAWLAALPGSLRKNVEEKVLVTSWKKRTFLWRLGGVLRAEETAFSTYNPAFFVAELSFLRPCKSGEEDQNNCCFSGVHWIVSCQVSGGGR